jgi:inosine-uridine nucleoside N-ribohydrolase/formylmethanofuran dehydrogenase subunit E
MMNKVLFSIVLFFTCASLLAQPLQAKLKHTLIIDTDCGFDDMRAITLLLSRSEVDIKAIVTSDGSLSPSEGAEKIRALLHEFSRDQIPVAAGYELDGINPPFRRFVESINWGDRKNEDVSGLDAPDRILNILSSEDEKITLVCLGPLTNIVKALSKNNDMLSGIDRIIWYNETINPPAGFNYECDKKSADALLKSNVRIDVISNLGQNNALFDSTIINTCFNSKTTAARVLSNVLDQKQVIEKQREGHFKLCDDLVALYITNPELFSINSDMGRLNIRYNTDYDVPGIKEAIDDMIEGSYVSEHNIVFNRFPAQREMFNYDIRPIIDTVITLYGTEEWKVVVMTDEFHGHLGVFSIVGAKMGIKARELFGVGPDVLEVTSFAGSQPPYSCLNDGIQVSTGATVGMGLIHVAKGRKTSPSALFSYDGRTIRISLKKEYLDMVDEDINEGIVKFGLLDDGYWKLVRRNALKYWVDWDRNKIFDIEETGKSK